MRYDAFPDGEAQGLVTPLSMNTNAATEVVIEFRSVEYRLDDTRPLLTEVSLEVRRGETLVFLGRSGSGKTTTLKLINRLLEPTSGEVKAGLPPLGIRFGYAVTLATLSRKSASCRI
jgi:ABC-type multidrug transport system fused ATPase/permease subunit